jgi:hypothetical protein
MTSMAAILGEPIPMADVRQRVAAAFAETFHLIQISALGGR